MEVSTTIKGMVHGNQIYVPDYQRAYSWDTDQISVFLDDLENYCKSNAKTPYYFGHFLYEKTNDETYAIIDGQQRLTTTVIFLCVLFDRIKTSRELTDEELNWYEDLIKRRSTYRFSTVHYDDQLFKDYVIDQTKKDHNNIDTSSGQRIINAYDYFREEMKDMELSHLESLLHAIVNASCTTHIVNSKAEAIQMFIFQNDRGKQPSHLEVIKAQFMYNIHIYGGEETNSLIKEVKNRFEHIYRSISDIEDFVDEDNVLTLTLKVYFNSLQEWDAAGCIEEELGIPECITFIKEFSLALEQSFKNLSRLKKDKNNDINIEAALLCGQYGVVLPFFIKAYNNDIPLHDISRMAKALGDIVLRHKVIETRAGLSSRLDDVFQELETSVDAIIERIETMKKSKEDFYWLGRWNNDELRRTAAYNWVAGNHYYIAKVILWKYENYLIANEGKSGYAPIHFDKNFHLEHIAPQTENGKEAAGYDIYDDDFRDNYLSSLGNFLLLSAPHNESIGNKPFAEKRSTYDQLRQQREIQEMTETDRIWNREKIAERKKKIIQFMVENL